MIILDTNVLSETMRERPEPRVLRWIDSQPPDEIFLTTVTEAEIRYGIALLPDSRRRTALDRAADHAFAVMFRGRILPFDSAATVPYAAIAARRRAAGRPIGHLDCQIAAVALARGATVATRNTEDFTDAGITVIDPWAVG